jgi:hypothetical protein
MKQPLTMAQQSPLPALQLRFCACTTTCHPAIKNLSLVTKPATTHPKSIKTFEIHYGIRKTSQSGKLWQNLAEKIIVENIFHIHFMDPF